MSEDIKDALVLVVLPVAIFLLILSIYCNIQFEDPFCYLRNQCYGYTYTEKLKYHHNNYGTIKLVGGEE